MISSKAKYHSTQSLPSKHCFSVFGNPTSLSFFAKSDGESVISSSLFANPPYFDENLRDFEIEAAKQNLGPSLVLKKLRTRLPKKKTWKCVSLSCVFSAISLRILFTHLSLVHSDDEFQVICGLWDSSGGQKVFHKYNSF